MKNSADRGCYPPRPKTEVDNTLRDMHIRRDINVVRDVFLISHHNHFNWFDYPKELY